MSKEIEAAIYGIWIFPKEEFIKMLELWEIC